MQSKTYKLIELLVFFVAIPLLFLLPFAIVIKMAIGLIGFVYIIFVLLRIEKMKFKLSKTINWKRFWKDLIIKLVIIIIFTTIYQWLINKTQLFYVLRNKPQLWLMILFIYSFFSVYPQELIYRTFFFQRYAQFFTNKYSMIVVNALLFSLGHIFFRNSFVLVLTFLGGIIFALTFYKTRSTVLVSIEHAIYGCWLFTVGMGSMLGFPS